MSILNLAKGSGMTEYGYSHPISIRFNDLDANGHVNNTVYTDYFQEARITYLRDLFGDDWRGASVVVATLTIDFLAPIDHDDDVWIDIRIVDVGTSSWTVDYRVRARESNSTAERVAAEGSSVQVAWDRTEEASRPLPQSWRDRLEAELRNPDA